MSQEQQQIQRRHAPSSLTLEVQIRQPHQDCSLYTWDHKHACLRFDGVYHAASGLPADLAALVLAEHKEVPVFVIHHQSLPPRTLVNVRLLGALHGSAINTSENAQREEYPLTHTYLITRIEAEGEDTAAHDATTLPPAQKEFLRHYIAEHIASETATQHTLVFWDAQTTEQKIRAARLFLKRRQREQTNKAPSWRDNRSVERRVAWRAVEELPSAVRRQFEQEHARSTGVLDPQTPYARAEHLIRFVPLRFQEELAHLLLENERLLAFIERPLLRQRAGWFGRQERLAHEGLFLVTDRQVLWLSDYFSSRDDTTLRGYHAHSLPLERLTNLAVLDTHAETSWNAHHLALDSIYQHLAFALNSTVGQEICTIAFPTTADLGQALQRITEIVRAFLPMPPERTDQRMRCVPHVEAYVPRAEEARLLEGLGGMVPSPSRSVLEHALAERLSTEQCLASALVPALEEYRSPHRLIALTAREVLVINGRKGAHSTVQVQHYPLHQLSSVQISYSLLGSNLTLFRPWGTNELERVVLPFQSPAMTLFLPLFTSLRLLINSPALERYAPLSEKAEVH
jgi:hypothetical protein